jgi:hypothetical protein
MTKPALDTLRTPCTMCRLCSRLCDGMRQLAGASIATWLQESKGLHSGFERERHRDNDVVQLVDLLVHLSMQLGDAALEWVKILTDMTDSHRPGRRGFRFYIGESSLQFP